MQISHDVSRGKDQFLIDLLGRLRIVGRDCIHPCVVPQSQHPVDFITWVGALVVTERRHDFEEIGDSLRGDLEIVQLGKALHGVLDGKIERFTPYVPGAVATWLPHVAVLEHVAYGLLHLCARNGAPATLKHGIPREYVFLDGPRALPPLEIEELYEVVAQLLRAQLPAVDLDMSRLRWSEIQLPVVGQRPEEGRRISKARPAWPKVDDDGRSLFVDGFHLAHLVVALVIDVLIDAHAIDPDDALLVLKLQVADGVVEVMGGVNVVVVNDDGLYFWSLPQV